MNKAGYLLASIRKSLSDPEQGAGALLVEPLRSAIDVALNTLQLRESPLFFLEHIRTGHALLKEGRTIALSKPHAENRGAGSVDFHENTRTDALEGEISRLRAELLEIVNLLDESRSTREKRYLADVCDWESGYYRHFLEPADLPRADESSRISKTALQHYLERRHPEWTGLRVVQFTALSGGFSKNTVLFETHDEVNGNQSLVMRAEQAFNLLCYEGSDVTKEFHMIQFMRNQGLPVAEPLWVEPDPTLLGCRFIVSRKVEGRILGGALGSHEVVTDGLIRSLMATFAQMHGIKIDPSDASLQRSHLNEWLPFADSLYEVTRYYVTEYIPRMIRATKMPASPQIARALKWLERNIPRTDEAPAIIHGDYSFNNLLMDNHRVAAVLDWESSRLSDPAEDIIWTQQNIGRYVDMEAFLGLYRSLTGRHITQERLAYFRVAKCVLNATTCMSAARTLETSAASNTNLALLAYKYMGIFGAEFNALIAEAERHLGSR